MTRKQNELIKIAITIKNIRKTDDAKYKIRTKIVECKTVTDINLKLTTSWFPLVFTETTIEVERIKIKYRQSSKIHQYFLKTNLFEVILVIR